MRRIETRHHGCQFLRQRFELASVALNDPREIGHLNFGLLQVRTLTLAQFARVLNPLFDSRNRAAGLVVARLNGAQRVCFRGLIGANALYFRFRFAQVREHAVHCRFAGFCRGIAYPGLPVQTLQAQGQQFGLQFALLFFQRLIASCRSRLTLQVPNLLFHLFAHIVQSIEILARVADSVFRFAAPLLVARNARGFLQKRAQVVRTRFDDARNHALLDDGITARSQARAEEKLSDVLTADFRAIDEVIRGAIAAHGAAQRDLVVGRVLSADLAVGIVEHHFDRCRAQRLTRGGAVEYDVGHRIAAQMLRGDFAHDPAHRIDDVGLPASIRTHYARQAAGKSDGRRIDEGFEAGNFEFR